MTDDQASEIVAKDAEIATLRARLAESLRVCGEQAATIVVLENSTLHDDMQLQDAAQSFNRAANRIESLESLNSSLIDKLAALESLTAKLLNVCKKSLWQSSDQELRAAIAEVERA